MRAIVRTREKGDAWAARGCDVAIVEDASDAGGVARALEGTTGAFLMNPPDYDPKPGFPDAHHVALAYADAITRAGPKRVVALSSIGAQVERFNLLNNAGILERALSSTGLPTVFLRPAWFIENAAWDIEGARKGQIESYLQPADHAIDMVSVRDIGRVAADLLREGWQGHRVVELKGPRRMSCASIAAGFASALGHVVQLTTIPRGEWEARFLAEGMLHPEGRMAMLDGFNDGWLDFAGGDAEQRIGTTDPIDVLASLVTSN